MQISVEATEGLERRMRVQVPAEQVDREVENRLRSYGRTAKLKGFRPGKIPFKVIKQQYGGQIRQQVLSELMQSSFSEAVSQEQLMPAGGPRIEPGNLEEGKDLEYTAIFEVYPEVEVKALDKIKIERPVSSIGEEDIDRVVENLREQRATWQTVERKADNGDKITVDFAGTLDGEPFDGGTGTDVPVVLGEGRMLADFEKGLMGAAAGEERGFDVKFPKDYQEETLAGKKVRFETTTKSVEEKVLPELDEEFCKAFGVEDGGLDKLRADVRDNMTREMAQTVRTQVKKQVLDGLHDANPVEVPAALVDDEAHRMQHDMQHRLGITDPEKVPPREVFAEQARKRVALGLIINEIVSGNDISLDPQQVEAKLAEMASEYQDPEQVIRSYRGNQQVMQGIESMVLEEQVVAWVLEQAKVKDKKIAFSKLMNLDQA